MENINNELVNSKETQIHFGHLTTILFVAVLLLGISWMKNPALFVFHSQSKIQNTSSSAPQYYAYVAPPEYQAQPAVLGANTNQGPSIIQDDGTVVPVDMGQVLAASTEGVVLSLDEIKVKAIPDSEAAVIKYFSEIKIAENGSIDQTEFAGALSSGNQEQINAQAQKINNINQALQKLSVPQSLVKLQKLKIIQYNSAIALLQNFTTADQNPEPVAQTLQQFMKSEQDLDAENIAVAQKFGSLDPDAWMYVDSNGNSLSEQSALNNLSDNNAGE